MPDYTRKGIVYPLPGDLIKASSVRSKLADDMRAQAETTDAAIGSEGARAQSAATHTAIQTAISDANQKYGALPGLVAEAENLVDQQETKLYSHETRISAVETLGGLAPGDVSDATVASVVANPASQAGESLRQAFDIRSANNTKNYSGTSQQRLEQALADEGIVQLDEPVTHTGNIEGFWSTNVFGTGVIHLPDGSTFTPDPKPGINESITNTLYVDADTGNNNDDGLTPSTAFRTIRAVYTTILRRLTAQQAAGAQWVIKLTGIFNHPSYVMNQLPDFPKGLVFEGEPLVDGYPVTEIVYPGTGSSIGLYFEPGVYQVHLRNIHFRGWKVNFNGYGALMKFGGKITATECEFTDNDIGISAIQNVNFTFARNFFNPGNNTAIAAQYNSTGNANYNTLVGGEGDTNGISISRNVVAHTDYNDIQGYRRGIRVDMNSRTAAIENIIHGCEIGVEVSSAAEWNNNGNIFYNNVTNYAHHGLGREVRMHSSGAHTGGEMRIAATHASPVYGFEQTHSIGTAAVIIYTGGLAGEIPGQWFDSPGKRLRLVLHGEFLTAPTASVNFEVGSVYGDGTGWKQFILAIVPGGKSGPFQVEAIIQAKDMANQITTANTLVGGSLSIPTEARTLVSTSDADMTERRLVRVRARTSSGTEQLKMYYMEVFAIG